MKNGISKYVKASVDIYFEPDHIACAYCQLLSTEKRHQCMRTGELIIDSKSQIGNFCPLKFEEESNV